MPIPNKEESKDDFMKRCVPMLIDEGKKQEQAVAQCGGLFDNKKFIKEYVNEKKMEFCDLIDVEVFSAGRWRGKNSIAGGDIYTEKDLDDIVEAHTQIGKFLKPNMHFGHDQQIKNSDGEPAIGWVTELKRVGIKLVANIKRVPKKIKELIDVGAYGRFSPEIGWNYEDTNTGKKFSRVFKGLALLGAAIPACDSIDDFINLYGLNKDKLDFLYNNNENNDIKIYKEKIQEVNTMTPEEIKTMQEENAKLKTDNKDLTGKNEDNEKKYTELETESSKKDETISDLKDTSKKEKVDAYLETKVKDGDISLAQKHFYVSIAMSDEIKANDNGIKVYSYEDGEDKKQIEFSDTFDLIKKVIDCKSDINTEDGKSKDIDLNKKTYSKDNEEAEGDILDDRIKKYIETQGKAGKEVDFETAYEHEAIAMAEESRNGGAK